MKKQTIGIFLLMGAAAVAAWYFLIRPRSQSIDQIPADPADNQCYNALVALFKQRADSSALNWMLPFVKGALNGSRPIDGAYLVNGKVTKSGAFMSVYAATYYGYGYKVDGKTGQDMHGGKVAGNESYEAAMNSLNDAMYAIFYQYQQQATEQAIIKGNK